MWLDGNGVERAEVHTHPRLALQRLGEIKFTPTGVVRERVTRRLVKLHGWETVAPALLPGAACAILGLTPLFETLSDSRKVFAGVEGGREWLA